MNIAKYVGFEAWAEYGRMEDDFQSEPRPYTGKFYSNIYYY